MDILEYIKSLKRTSINKYPIKNNVENTPLLTCARINNKQW